MTVQAKETVIVSFIATDNGALTSSLIFKSKILASIISGTVRH